MNRRRCIGCKTSKPLTRDYYRLSKTYRGIVYLSRTCKECKSAADSHNSKTYQKSHPERFWITKTVSCALRRARNSKVPADRNALRQIAMEHIHGSPCLCCGTPMTFFSSGTRNTWASLDRVIPSRGYVHGNLQFICYRCNLLKSDATISEMENILKYMKKHCYE